MRERRRAPLHTRIFVGLALGAALGFGCQVALGKDNPGLLRFVDDWAQPIGQLFLRMIFMVVVPLLVSALILGVAEIGEAHRLGRVGARSLFMTVLLSGIAVVLALTAVNLVRPGGGIDPQRREQLLARYSDAEDAAKRVEQSKEGKSVAQTILAIVPENPFEESAKPKLGGILQLMFFALVFGVALSKIEAEKAQPVVAFLQGVFAVSLKMIDYAMALAPIGVAALIFTTAATLGLDAFLALGKYATVVLCVLALHLFGTYSLVLRFIARRNPWAFFRQIRGVMLTAFATASSNATLPTALRSAEEDVGLPRDISSFVLTVGATANQNGTALFEGITVLFLAQVFGLSLDLGQQATVLLMCILAGVGTAGVPGGAWPMIAAILGVVGAPPGAIALCMGIDRPLDMSRTVLNVAGDITIAACVSEMEARSQPAHAT